MDEEIAMPSLRALAAAVTSVLGAGIAAGLMVELLGAWGAHARRRTLARQLHERERALATARAAQRHHAYSGAGIGAGEPGIAVRAAGGRVDDQNLWLRPYAHTPEIWGDLLR